jgi:hypothetical protein
MLKQFLKMPLNGLIKGYVKVYVYFSGMHGLTPYSKLKNSKSAINPHVLKFPVVLIEDLLKTAGLITMFLKSHLTGKYVHTK